MDPVLRARLLDKVALFPAGPGVYTFLDDRSRVLYVGKAKSLRARVRSYLREDADDGRLFYRFLVRSLADVQSFSTASEKEALLLENTLIKRHRPRWNVKLTDDKSFLQIEVTTHAAWPRARLVRAAARGKRGEVFGPYASARAVRETLRIVKRWFPLRTCSDVELRQRTRPCIEHEMGRCLAPCVARCTEDEYAQAVEEAALFLRGKDEALLPRLRARMAEHSAALRYEQAARVRDQIAAIERTLEGQRVAAPGGGDRDVLGVAAHDGGVVVLVLEVREGQVTEPRTFELRTPLAPPEALNAFLGQFYGAEGRYLPREVLLPFEVEDRALLAEVLSERRGAQVAIKASVRGERRGLLELARKNAALALETGEERRRLTREVLEALQATLTLARPPARIECFDVSTIQGAFTVASQVRFRDGDPDPTGYRTYKVRTVDGQDDFAAMEEVLERRLRRGLDEDDLPELIVVDGGPSQLARALLAAERVGVPPGRTALVGLAKARRAGARRHAEDRRAFERIHLPGGGEPILLSPASLVCRFLARIRDAAHRAAVGYHRELRRKSALRSGLEEVPGVGPKRRLELLRQFGSLRRIRAASVDELAEVVPRAVAHAIAEFVGQTVDPGAAPGDPQTESEDP